MEDAESFQFAAIDDALDSGHADIASVAHEVGASAANLGSPLQEAFDQLERAYARHDATPAYDVVKALAISWSEAALAHHHQSSCEDPLTALSTLSHLRSRLGDLYRAAERDGSTVGDSYALVIVELPFASSTNPLVGSLDMLEAAVAMRTVFSGDETISQVAPRRAAALVERSRTDRPALELLQILVRPHPLGVAEPRLWIVSLPRNAIGIGWLLTELAR
ncbi:MAG: hypothetical protein M3Q98_01925 [Actinomycetota bacterium]|nr:hypothetical protein [Actinomycetota bacterium]